MDTCASGRGQANGAAGNGSRKASQGGVRADCDRPAANCLDYRRLSRGISAVRRQCPTSGFHPQCARFVTVDRKTSLIMLLTDPRPTAAPATKLVIDHVSKWFQTSSLHVHALDDVSLR